MEADPLSQSIEPTSALSSRAFLLSAAVALVAGGLLRIWMLRKFFEVNGDSQLYGGMAKNLLLQGRYAVADGNGMLHSTLIRLPGYPLFLAACFQLFGMENYIAAACVQIVLELIGCVLLALFAWRVSPTAFRMRSAHAALWLAALCPFTAIYAAEPLTEAPTLFAIALALWALARFQDRDDWGSALAFTLSVTYAALLRPDGALVGAALLLPMLFAPMHRIGMVAQSAGPRTSRSIDLPSAHLRKVLVCLLLALTPFTLWTIRNWRVFHVFQPLAPRYATDPGEDTWPGWQRWVKTWCLDFVSTYQVYWNMPGAPLDIKQLPGRAIDSPAQYAETAKLMADYEANGEEMSQELDARFGQLADARIAAHPLRSHVLLPLGRMADMWVRPRVENLPIDLDWWVYKHHHVETRFTWFYAGLNAFYLLLGLAGLLLRPRLWVWTLLYMALRSALLCTIEAPEARYTIECFPMLFVLGGIALGRLFAPRPIASRTTSV
jgi:hypothetical protein